MWSMSIPGSRVGSGLEVMVFGQVTDKADLTDSIDQLPEELCSTHHRNVALLFIFILLIVYLHAVGG